MTDSLDARIAAMKAAAERAKEHQPTLVEWYADGDRVRERDGRFDRIIAEKVHPIRAAHIAASNPANVLALIGRLEDAQRNLSIMTEKATGLWEREVALLALLSEAGETLKPFAVSVPAEMPDNVCTECKTHETELSDEEVARVESVAGKGALLSRKSNLILWLDGVDIGHFRRARDLSARIAAALPK